MSDPAPLLRRLAGRRLLARAAILFEAVWPALWPPLAVTGVFICAALLDLPPLLPAALHVALLALVALAFVGLLIRGVRHIRLPDDGAADRRLETRSGLVHRPLSVLTDKPATEDPVGAALWRVHATRALTQIGRLHVGLPRPGLAAARPARAAVRGAVVRDRLSGDRQRRCAGSALCRGDAVVARHGRMRRPPSCRPGSPRPPTRVLRRSS